MRAKNNTSNTKLPLNQILNFVEERLVACYRRLMKQDEARSVPWTIGMKETLVTLGKEVSSLGCKDSFLACASPHLLTRAEYGEWLFDVIWYREQGVAEGGYLLDVPLCAEIEWNPEKDHVDPDFQKLIVARIPIKLWVFWVDRTESIAKQFSYCERQRTAYRGWGDDGVYLLMGFAGDGYKSRTLRIN